ncbi:pectinesterase family protein [Sutcliffiella rhizosphaerae]|uniref:Pectinesterase A n=1 Tax=Sutcliffiella rhizosphaerae TaxID=2880967 RepID=A0ABM8YM56_9BACI|nr:pectinesterase family protein [Sutcliffiella rhizosphaerae]CAG9620957.1 Pectinesterase A [Sutcliffiella rhizosphaerae]
MQYITVSQDGLSDFDTIQAAIDSIRVHPLEPVTVLIKNGEYKERVIIPENKSPITLQGESSEKTIITFHRCATMKDKKGQPIGTFQTAVVTSFADNIRIENLTIVNSAGYGHEIGQALALYISGDKSTIKEVKLLGNQDTLYASKGKQLYKNCYIEGHVDFIFGAASAIFHQCEIHSLRKGYITAASTPEDAPYGFVFIDCKLTGVATDDSVFLGRPWRPYAHTIFINTWMGSHIKQVGWDNWRNMENESTSYYGEFESTGPGAFTEARVSWSKALTKEEADTYEIHRLLSNW